MVSVSVMVPQLHIYQLYGGQRHRVTLLDICLTTVRGYVIIGVTLDVVFCVHHHSYIIGLRCILSHASIYIQLKRCNRVDARERVDEQHVLVLSSLWVVANSFQFNTGYTYHDQHQIVFICIIEHHILIG